MAARCGVGYGQRSRPVEPAACWQWGIVTNTGSDLPVILPENVTFATGSSVVNSDFLPPPRDMAQPFGNYPNSTVQVARQPIMWDLQSTISSFVRIAPALFCILIGDGTQSGRVSQSGRSFTQPVASGATAAGWAQKRQVEIVITPIN